MACATGLDGAMSSLNSTKGTENSRLIYAFAPSDERDFTVTTKNRRRTKVKSWQLNNNTPKTFLFNASLLVSFVQQYYVSSH